MLADDTPAVDAVLKADKYELKIAPSFSFRAVLIQVTFYHRVRWALLQEEKQLLSELEKKAG